MGNLFVVISSASCILVGRLASVYGSACSEVVRSGHFHTELIVRVFSPSVPCWASVCCCAISQTLPIEHVPAGRMRPFCISLEAYTVLLVAVTTQ